MSPTPFVCRGSSGAVASLVIIGVGDDVNEVPVPAAWAEIAEGNTEADEGLDGHPEPCRRFLSAEVTARQQLRFGFCDSVHGTWIREPGLEPPPRNVYVTCRSCFFGNVEKSLNRDQNRRAVTLRDGSESACFLQPSIPVHHVTWESRPLSDATRPYLETAAGKTRQNLT